MQGVDGVAPIGKADATGGGKQTVDSLVIQDGHTGGPAVWIGFLGSVVPDDKDGGNHPCWVPTQDCGEAVNTSRQWVMGYTGSQGDANGGRDEFGGHLQRPLAGDVIIVGGYTKTTGVLCMGNRL